MRLALIAGIAMMAGCGFVRDPIAIDATETEYGVFGILYAGRDTVTIVVAEFPPAPPPGDFGWNPVSNAGVRLVSGADTIALAELPASAQPCVTQSGFGTAGGRTAGCYRVILPSPVVAGATYSLVADIPGFGRITGNTTVPGAPAIDAPAQGTSLSAEFVDNQWPSMLLRLSPGPHTQRLEARLIESDPNRVCEVHFLENSGFGQLSLTIEPEEADSVPALFRAACFTATGPAPLGQLPVTIRVTAYDANYARFASTVVDPHSNAVLRRHTRAGIDRGVGYFGGGAVTERRVQLTGSGT